MEFGEYKQFFHCLDELEPQEVEWLWYPYLPRGKITILQGDPGEGKTTLALQIAALLTRGYVYGDTTKRPPCRVMLQSAEDGLRDTIIPRLIKSGADRRYIVSLREDESPLTLTDELFRAAVSFYHPDLLIIDPLQAYLGADVDMHRANEVRPVLSSLAELAEHCGTAVLLIGHMNKMSGIKALYKGLGSIDIAAAARSVLVAARNPQDKNSILMGQIKSSLAPAGPVLGFERQEKGPLQFLGEQHVDLERLIDGCAKQRPRERAAAFLEEELVNGKRPVCEIIREARNIGIKETTIKRAARDLDVDHIRIGNQFYYALPDTYPEEDSSPE